MTTRIKLLTAEDLYQLPSDLRGELVNGVFIEMAPPGPEHAGVTMTIGWLLSSHVRARALGRVMAEAGFVIRRDPDTVRAPDVAFVRAERIPPAGLPRRFWELAPDLVVEVISPSDTPAEVEAKLRDWLEAGARLVWLVYPDNRTVQVVRSLRDRERLDSDALLDGGDVVPGFSCRVAELFE